MFPVSVVDTYLTAIVAADAILDLTFITKILMIESALLALGFSEDSETYRYLVKSFYATQPVPSQAIAEPVKEVKEVKK